MELASTERGDLTTSSGRIIHVSASGPPQILSRRVFVYAIFIMFHDKYPWRRVRARQDASTIYKTRMLSNHVLVGADDDMRTGRHAVPDDGHLKLAYIYALMIGRAARDGQRGAHQSTRDR